MCTSPVLIQPDFNKQFFLQADASAYSVGAVLSQEGEHLSPSLAKRHKPIRHPVAYYSTTFSPTKRNYNIYERKLLAVMKSLAHWQQYLGWTREPFIIVRTASPNEVTRNFLHRIVTLTYVTVILM